MPAQAKGRSKKREARGSRPPEPPCFFPNPATLTIATRNCRRSSMDGSQTTITRQTAAAEILNRRKIRRTLRGFIEAFSWEPPPARHHRLLIDKLEEIISGDL